MIKEKKQNQALEGFLSVPEAAEFIGCKPQTVYKKIRLKKIMAYHLFDDGKKIFIKKSELEKALVPVEKK